MINVLVKIFLVFAILLAASFLFFAVRKVRAAGQIEREWQSTPDATTYLESTSRLEILPLYEEASTDDNLAAGHGVSYLIRTDTFTLLLDAGNNPSKSDLSPFLKNMQSLGIAWEEIDAVMISHPHPDHLGGIDAWRKRTISLGTGPNEPGVKLVYVPTPITYPGANLVQLTEPAVIGPGIATTGVLSYPEVFPLSVFNPIGREHGLVVNVSGKGLVLITGCGHPTLEKLVSRAEALYGQPVVGVVGGLHYEAASQEDVQPHIQFLASRQPQLVALSPHDNGPQAIQAFQAAFPEAYQYVQVGQSIQFP